MYRLLSAGLICLSALISAQQAAAQEAAAHFLPESVVIYAETAPSGDLLAATLTHPLRAKLEEFPPYQQWSSSDERAELMFAVRYVEAQLGTPWRPAIEKLAAGGIAFAVDGATEGVAILVKSDDADFLARTRDTLLKMARADAAEKGNPEPFKTGTYRGIQAYRADDLRFAVVKDWLVLVSSDELGKAIVDRLLDGDGQSLADSQKYQQAIAERSDDALAWIYADLTTIREAGVVKELLGGQASDPGAELLFGGVLNALHHAPFATAQLTSDRGAFELSMAVPHDSAQLPLARQFFFGPQQQGFAPAQLSLPETLLEIRAYRGISRMWLHGPDLFDEEVNADLAKANSDLSTLFGGRPFAEEILGALDGQLQLLAVRENSTGVPAGPGSIHLPGFAAVGQLKEPGQDQRPLRIAFQTAIGFINLTGVQEGRPPLELETQRSNGRTLLSASFAAEDLLDADSDQQMAPGAASLLALSPTLGFVDDAVVIASTRSLAEQLLDALEARASAVPRNANTSGAPRANTAIRLQAAPLRAVLAENRERLVAQNMLEKGHNRQEAEGEIDALLGLLDCVDKAELALMTSSDRLELKFHVAPVAE